MKVIVLTESQVERLIDEQMLSFVGFGGGNSLTNKLAVKAVQKFYTLDPHTRLEVIEAGASFIPEAGPVLAAGIGSYNAQKYWKEGKKKEAAITLFMAMIPFATDAKIFKTIGEKGMVVLAEKIIGNRQLTQLEMQAINAMEKNPKLTELVKDYVNDTFIEKAADTAYDAAGKVIKKTTQALAPNANRVAARAISNAPKVAYNNPNLIGKGRKV
jgi:hypothetical protein